MGKCRVVEYLEGSLSDGGAETLVKDYALMLNKDKFDVSIVVDWIIPDSANYLRLKDSGVDIISLYPRRSVFWRAVNKFFREQYIDLAIKRTLKRIKPDVLHIHLLHDHPHGLDRADRTGHDASSERREVILVEVRMTELGNEHCRDTVERGAFLPLDGIEHRRHVKILAYHH